MIKNRRQSFSAVLPHRISCVLIYALLACASCSKPSLEPKVKDNSVEKEASAATTTGTMDSGAMTENKSGIEGASKEEKGSGREVSLGPDSGYSIPVRPTFSDRFLRAPRLTELPLPTFPGAHAIWGATGRDAFGHIYFGVASYGVDNPSAHLFRYSPHEGDVKDLGAVNEQLSRLGVRKSTPYDETQMKIHSKIFQAADGLVYFSSQDEHDELGDGSRNALFGGRLFSLNPKTLEWQSIMATPEGLIAAACSGRYVSAMGYFGSVIYQYDTKTKNVRSKRVGTVGGHVSRNFFMDKRHHTYAIRLEEFSGGELLGVETIGDKKVRASLVELSEDLTEISSTPLDEYRATLGLDSHGMTAYCHTDSGVLFLTHSGVLWEVSVGEGQLPSKVEKLGWFHPDGSRYAASLFCPSGDRYVMGFADSKNSGHEWVVYDLDKRQSFVLDLPLQSQTLLSQDGLLIYGCDTIDDGGASYVVGWKKIPEGYGPYVFRLTWH